MSKITHNANKEAKRVLFHTLRAGEVFAARGAVYLKVKEHNTFTVDPAAAARSHLVDRLIPKTMTNLVNAVVLCGLCGEGGGDLLFFKHDERVLVTTSCKLETEF